MGPGLTSMASGVEIQAPTITLVDSGAVSTYGGDLIIGNTPVCP